VTVAVCERLPLVAVISGCDVAGGVFDAVLIARRAWSIPGGRTFEVVPLLSVQVAEDPLGSLLASKVTDPVNPLCRFTATM
jgi:hypothetical protein